MLYSTGPGSPMPILMRSAGVAVDLRDEAAPGVDDPAEHALGAIAHGQCFRVLHENRAGEVRDREVRVGCADVGRQYEPRCGVEGEL